MLFLFGVSISIFFILLFISKFLKSSTKLYIYFNEKYTPNAHSVNRIVLMRMQFCKTLQKANKLTFLNLFLILKMLDHKAYANILN